MLTDDKYDVQRGGLYINNVTSSDEGDYFCQATVESSGMFREQRIQLKLLGMFQLVTTLVHADGRQGGGWFELF